MHLDIVDTKLSPWFYSARHFISQVPELMNSGFHLDLHGIFTHNSTNIIWIKHFTSFHGLFDIISVYYTIIINDRINAATLITIIYKLNLSNLTNLYADNFARIFLPRSQSCILSACWSDRLQVLIMHLCAEGNDNLILNIGKLL